MAAGFGHHRGKFAVAEGADHRQNAGDNPRAENKGRELAVRAMSASTRKMPDPIMEPATSAVELNSPSVCTIVGASWDVGGAFDGGEFRSRHWACFI